MTHEDHLLDRLVDAAWRPVGLRHQPSREATERVVISVVEQLLDELRALQAFNIAESGDEVPLVGERPSPVRMPRPDIEGKKPAPHDSVNRVAKRQGLPPKYVGIKRERTL